MSLDIALIQLLYSFYTAPMIGDLAMRVMQETQHFASVLFLSRKQLLVYVLTYLL